MSKPRRLPSGSWRIQWVDHAGKRQSATFGNLDAARAALRRRGTEIDDIKSGRKDPGSDRTFAEVAESFLESRKRGPDPRRVAARLSAYRSHLDTHLLPIVGALPMYAIGPDAVDRLIASLVDKPTGRPGEKNAEGRKLAPSTIRNVITAFRLVMKHARRPVVVELPKGLKQDKAHARKRPTAIGVASDVSKYLDACRPEWFRITSALAIYSGLRRGEIASLRWSAIDADEGTIAVMASWSGKPKNDQARTVPLPPELAGLLRRWRLATGASGDGFVVVRPGTDGRDRPLQERDELAGLARRTCTRAGIEPVTFHALRATFGTHAADAGMPIGQLRAILGHANITTTAIYLRSDSAVAAVDPRARLAFERPGGDVVALPVRGAHAMHTPGGK